MSKGCWVIYLDNYKNNKIKCSTVKEKLGYIASAILSARCRENETDLTDSERLDLNEEWQTVLDVVRENVPDFIGVILRRSSGWISGNSDEPYTLDCGNMNLHEVLLDNSIIFNGE